MKRPSSRAVRPLRAALLAALLFASRAAAEPPAIDFLYPAGGKRGAHFTVTLGGKFDPWPVQVWADHPGLRFTTNESKGKLTVEISTNAPVGPHLIRIFNPDGATPPKLFCVGHSEEVADREPNDTFDKAQPLDTLPVAVNGRLDKSGDADCFGVMLSAQQSLVVWTDAYGLDSPLDPVLHLLDAEGNKIAFTHDGRGLDAMLVYRAEKAGRYVVQLTAFAFPPKADVRLAGGDACVYRLFVSTGPVAEYALPTGVQRGQVAPIQIFGWNLGVTGQALRYEIDTTPVKPSVHQILLGWPVIENQLPIMVSDGAEPLEAEPNDTRDLAQPLPIPGAISGRIDRDKDEDRFQFRATKGQALNFKVRPAARHLPIDPVLQIEDTAGKQLASNDDTGNQPEAALKWTAPSDGSFFLLVRDLLRHGGSNYVYRLAAEYPHPDFRATAEPHAVRLEPGKTAEIKVTVSRVHEFDGELHAFAENLPAGITATSAAAPARSEQTKILLSATADAKPANQPVRIAVVYAHPDAPRVRFASVELKGQNAASGSLLINETDHLWLTVIPKPPGDSSGSAQPEKKE